MHVLLPPALCSVRNFRHYANEEWATYQGPYSASPRRTAMKDEVRTPLLLPDGRWPEGCTPLALSWCFPTISLP